LTGGIIKCNFSVRNRLQSPPGNAENRGFEACNRWRLTPPKSQKLHIEETAFMTTDSNAKAYWSATLGLLTKVLIIWALVSYGAGILFAPMLNGIHLGGYPLGFWFAQQGSIYIFIVLIFYYAVKMGQIDRKFGMQED
jgi:putative solute:sodium symporter small subunit